MSKLVLFWVLITVGGAIYRWFKKALATTEQERRERPQPAAPALPDASFQELLRQLQSRDAPAAEAVPVVPPTAPAAPRTLGGRLMPRRIAPPVRSQERQQVKYKSLELPAVLKPISPATPVVRRAGTLPRATVTAQTDATFAPYGAAGGAAETAAAGVRRLLAQPANLRAAFVLSEIFQPKF